MLCISRLLGAVDMLRATGALILLAIATPAFAGTDFGIRSVGGKVRNDERMGFGTPVQAEKPAAAAAQAAATQAGACGYVLKENLLELRRLLQAQT